MAIKKGPKSGHNNDEDRALWQRVAGTVNPLGKKPKLSKPAKPLPPPPRDTVQPSARKAAPSPPPPLPLPPPVRFDKGEEEKLRRGKRSIEKRLDLHGMNQGEAYDALHRAIRSAQRQEKRTLLVITGKGRVGGGVLRRMLPLWLEERELREAILAWSPARPEDGGEGAFYIRLRKS